MQGLLHGGAKLDATAAADHTAALYCCINETLERLASRKMYKSGATALREGVDRALLMCSQLETSAGYELLHPLQHYLRFCDTQGLLCILTYLAVPLDVSY